MSDNQLTKGLKNIKYSFLAQAIILIIGVIKTLIIPSALSVESYAYWQMYLFYISYVGFFYLGFNDGILLKYGKYNYNDLPFEKMRRSMQFYIAMLAVFSVCVFAGSFMVEDSKKAFIIFMIAISIVMYGLNGVFIYVFLITNQIKRHSFFSAVDSVSSFIGIILMLLLNQTNYRYLIIFVFTIKLLSITTMAVLCKKVLFGKCSSIKVGFIEYLDNIKVGIFLMFAQVMSMLVTGLGRIFVEYSGELKNYAYYSFGMTVMSIVMVGITAVSTVMYPTLGRVDEKILPKFFSKMYNYFTHFTVISQSLYFPAYILIGILFTKYTPMLSYFPILFITMTWQSKVTITTNCYFRVLRMERKMLKVNIISVCCFCLVYFIISLLFGTIINNQIIIIAISTCVSMLVLEVQAESILRKVLNMPFSFHFMKDIAINIIFIATTFVPNRFIGLIVYLMFVVAYSVINRKQLKNDVQFLFHSFIKT